jgi:AcrR family transcriptional regulator
MTSTPGTHPSAEAGSSRSRRRPVGQRAEGFPLGSVEPADKVDGRVARSHRTRRSIIDALRALHRDGNLIPTTAQVAERAGVSRRTVWQHFADLETLFAEAGRVDVEIALSLVEPVDVEEPLATRIALFTSQRCRLLEEMSPPWRAARLQEPFSAQIRENKARMIELGREELKRAFAPELRKLRGRRRAQVVDAAMAATMWANWECLRTELGCTPSEARTAVATTLTGLFAYAAADGQTAGASGEQR